MSKKFTLEEVKEEFIKRNYIPLFNKYKNAQQKLSAKTQEGYKFEICLSSLKNQGIAIFHKHNPYTIENIKLWLQLNNKNKPNEGIELLSNKYEGKDEPLQWQCLKDDCREIFEASWHSIQQDKGCPFCRGLKVGLSNCLATRFPELIKDWNYEKNGDLTPYDVSYGSAKYVYWKCHICEHEWYTDICNRSSGNRDCLKCSLIKQGIRRSTPSENYNLLTENPELCKEWNYEKNEKRPKDYYPNSSKKVWWICEKGHEWPARIADRNNKNRNCPFCDESKGEKEIEEWLINNNFNFLTQKNFNNLFGLGNGLLSYDFYLPDFNLLIEYQGIQHERYVEIFHRCLENFEKQQEHDRRKREYAENNNIKLLEIWYYDFDNIEEILDKELDSKGSVIN